MRVLLIHHTNIKGGSNFLNKIKVYANFEKFLP